MYISKKLEMTFPNLRYSTPFRYLTFLLLCISLFHACSFSENQERVEVLVLGSGTGASSAAIQAARSGAKTLYVNPLIWHGGMLTAAGVSATDGNHMMPAGLWGEFRDKIYAHYGGPQTVATGWVSNTHFEPSVGATIFDSLLQETPNLSVLTNTTWSNIKTTTNGWEVDILTADSSTIKVIAKQLIDGTGLGDVAAQAGASFDVGMDSRHQTGETIAPMESNDMIQDLTYVAILKDYGSGKAPLVAKPENYSPIKYNCLCDQVCDQPDIISCEQMINYAKLPNNKYLINWPNHGNDYYINPVPLNQKERLQAYEAAKKETLSFIYFLQNELGYSNLGLADDEFPTPDRLALLPYHREGRRIHGLAQMRLQHITHPYQEKLYKTGIAVGDYPIDHHHGKNPEAPEFDFPAVPSFSVPAGALIPKNIPNLLMADKAISVTNIVNGSTRLQPVVLQIGQAAGLMAALAADQNITPADLSVREIQQAMLEAKGYLQPFYDVLPDDPDFDILHRIAATGLLMGTGEPYLWANRTWLYPDSLLSDTDLLAGLHQIDIDLESSSTNQPVTAEQAIEYLQVTAQKLDIKEPWVTEKDLTVFEEWTSKVGAAITRREWAVLADKFLQPFQRIPVNFQGEAVR